MTNCTSATGNSKIRPRLHRRDCLKALAAGWVGVQASAVLAGPWQAKAKKNVRLGIDGGV
jgi:sugar phosphate isomerase/epimerase